MDGSFFSPRINSPLERKDSHTPVRIWRTPPTYKVADDLGHSSAES